MNPSSIICDPLYAQLVFFFWIEPFRMLNSSSTVAGQARSSLRQRSSCSISLLEPLATHGGSSVCPVLIRRCGMKCVQPRMHCDCPSGDSASLAQILIRGGFSSSRICFVPPPTHALSVLWKQLVRTLVHLELSGKSL